MKNKTPLIILTMIIVLVAVTGAILFYLKTSYQNALEAPNSTSQDTVEFEILPGESIETIVPSLINQNLLKEEYRNYFVYYLKQKGLIPNIQAGTFQIPQNLTMVELAETLQRAQEPSIWVTIPEGLRADEIADIVSKKIPDVDREYFVSLIESQNFIDSLNLNIGDLSTLEGFLHPDRYLFKKESDSREIITVMVENFKNKVPEEYTHQDIILASLIEREAVNAQDRRIISGILKKRLEEQWLLQVDATLLYHHQDWGHTITVEDLERDHIFNTYKYHGLPPQPICNPGLDAILSVFEPTETDYYYYIHDKERNPHYSRNLQEHTQKVQQYLR